MDKKELTIQDMVGKLNKIIDTDTVSIEMKQTLSAIANGICLMDEYIKDLNKTNNELVQENKNHTELIAKKNATINKCIDDNKTLKNYVDSYIAKERESIQRHNELVKNIMEEKNKFKSISRRYRKKLAKQKANANFWRHQTLYQEEQCLKWKQEADFRNSNVVNLNNILTILSDDKKHLEADLKLVRENHLNLMNAYNDLVTKTADYEQIKERKERLYDEWKQSEELIRIRDNTIMMLRQENDLLKSGNAYNQFKEANKDIFIDIHKLIDSNIPCIVIHLYGDSHEYQLKTFHDFFTRRLQNSSKIIRINYNYNRAEFIDDYFINGVFTRIVIRPSGDSAGLVHICEEDKMFVIDCNVPHGKLSNYEPLFNYIDNIGKEDK